MEAEKVKEDLWKAYEAEDELIAQATKIKEAVQGIIDGARERRSRVVGLLNEVIQREAQEVTK